MTGSVIRSRVSGGYRSGPWPARALARGLLAARLLGGVGAVDAAAATGELTESRARRAASRKPGSAPASTVGRSTAPVRWGGIDEAEALYKRALAFKQTLLGRDHPGLATPLHVLAVTASAQRPRGGRTPLPAGARAARASRRAPTAPTFAASLTHRCGECRLFAIRRSDIRQQTGGPPPGGDGRRNAACAARNAVAIKRSNR